MKDTYTQKVTADISLTHNEGGVVAELDTHRTYRRKKEQDNLGHLADELLWKDGRPRLKRFGNGGEVANV